MNKPRKTPETSSKRLRVAILFGGKSAEHNVSIRSARSVLKALDTQQFEPVLIGIDRQGVWRPCEAGALLEDENFDIPTAQQAQVTFLPGAKGTLFDTVRHSTEVVDVVMPILHGPMGEDGTLQGLLELAGVPYVGAGVLGSAVNMDKDVMKRLLREAGLPITPHETLHSSGDFSAESLMKQLGSPLFVKPANMGSSVGVTKAENSDELRAAIQLAFRYDRKVIVEKAVEGDEIECSILGNNSPQASLPGRIIPGKEFYDYEAKYTLESGTGFEIPAKLTPEVTRQVQQVAIKAYQTLECEGMARVDMFLTKSNEVLVNEINTIPGFTSMSVYPMLWQESGVPYRELISKLLYLAIERFEQRRQHYSVQNENN